MENEEILQERKQEKKQKLTKYRITCVVWNEKNINLLTRAKSFPFAYDSAAKALIMLNWDVKGSRGEWLEAITEYRKNPEV